LAGDIGNLKVYASFNAISIDTPLYLAYGGSIRCPYNSNWVFFVDDHPYTGWTHPCRYIFVDAESGSDTVIRDKSIYPDSLFDHYEQVPHPFPRIPCEGQYNQPASFMDLPSSTNPHLYAVLIVGLDDSLRPSHGTAKFWNDVSALYSTLEEVYHYDCAKIFVHYYTKQGARGPDLDGGEQSYDIDYAAYLDTIRHTFRCLAGNETDLRIPELQPDDQLFIYTNSHGSVVNIPNHHDSHSSLWLPGKGGSPTDVEYLYDSVLADWTDSINCGQMIFLMQQCNSGGFVNWLKDYTTYNVKCKNRSVYTSVEKEADANYEYNISTMEYGEFTFYFTAAIRGYFPDIKGYKPWKIGFPVYDPVNYPIFPYSTCFSDTCESHPNINPDSNGDGVVTMEEAYNFTNNYDSSESKCN